MANAILSRFVIAVLVLLGGGGIIGPASPAWAQAVAGAAPSDTQIITWAVKAKYRFAVTQILQAKTLETGETCTLTEGDLASFKQVPAERDAEAVLNVVTSRAGNCDVGSDVTLGLADLRITLKDMAKRFASAIGQAAGSPPAVAHAAPAMAQAPRAATPNRSFGGRQPLLIKDKKTLYQRVLTRPGAPLLREPNTNNLVKEMPAFEVLYVYRRMMIGDQEWLEVGAGRDGTVDGWMPADRTIEWRHTLTVAFTNPAPRARALFFKSDEALTQVISAANSSQIASQLLETAVRGNLPEDFPVIAIEPTTYVDFTKQFYLLPILDWHEVTPPSGFSTRILRVASVTPSEAASNGDSGQAPSTAEMASFKAAVAFVIDTTKSMEPYIERTKEAVQIISQKINENPSIRGRVSFGLVGFRNNVRKTPGLEYLTKVFVSLQDGQDINYFLKRAVDVRATTVSSHSWDEDSFAGLLAAVNELDWTGFDARYLVMFTDAGSLRGNDPLASSQLDAEQVNRLLLDRNIAPFILHLLTPAGQRDHNFAAEQYQVASQVPNAGALYAPIDKGSVEQFGQVIDTIIDVVSSDIGQAVQGRVDLNQHRVAAKPKGQADVVTRMRTQAAAVSRAMQIAYLGRERGAQVPPVFGSWLADRDLQRPDLATVDVRILLTKNELNDLQETMKLVVEAAKKSEISPGDFFNQLRSAAAAMSRDPVQVSREQSRRLVDTGLIGEYLEDLPYRSKVMNIDQETWESWSIGEQQAFIDEIEDKIRLYQRFHDDTDRWLALDGGRSPGDAVYPVPLDSLP